MNVQFPPKDQCRVAWRKFVRWLEIKFGEDAGPNLQPEDGLPVFNMTFRHHNFAFCPFCGMEFDEKLNIWERHG